MSTLSIYPSKSIGERISRCLGQHKDMPVLFLISGGSALKALDGIDEQVLGSNTIVSVLDERLDVESKDRNFFQLMQTDFYKKARARSVKFVPLFDTNFSGTVIATMGIGVDGHTAGIMPFSEILESNEWISQYNAGERSIFPLRHTVTINFLKNKVDYAFVYVVGEDKKEILEKVLTSSDNMTQYPSRVIHHMKNVEMYTDLTK